MYNKYYRRRIVVSVLLGVATCAITLILPILIYGG